MLSERTATKAVRVRLSGLAYGFRFDHEGELVEATRKELVARVGPRFDRSRLGPRWIGQKLPGPTGGGFEPVPDADSPDVVRRVRATVFQFDYDEGEHPHRDIADGLATVRFHPDRIDVVAYDHNSSPPTDDDAPLAP